MSATFHAALDLARLGRRDGLLLRPAAHARRTYMDAHGQGRRERRAAEFAAGTATDGLHWFEWTWVHDPQPDRTFAWNVTLAALLVPYAETDTLPLAELLPFAEDTTYSEARLAQMTDADMARPLIAAMLPPDVTHGGRRVIALIDGRHRLERAVREGRALLEVAFLDDEASAACTLTPGQLAALRTP